MLSPLRRVASVAALRLRYGLAAFARGRSGNVVILFAFLCLPLLGFTGAAIDYGMATRLETKLQAATDATALALCQTPGATMTPVLQAQAATMMAGYMGAAVVVDTLGITANPRQITLTTHIPYPAFFGRITGVTGMRPQATARCATPLPKTFEIALVLDNTGSMLTASNGQSKMQTLKTAASNFVDYVYADTSKFATGTRIAIVPFAGSVAVDPGVYRGATWIDQDARSTYHWTNVSGAATAGFANRLGIFTSLRSAYAGWDWAGCFETLPYPLNTRDAAPSAANGDSFYLPMFAPDEPGDGTTGSVRYSGDWSYNSYIDDDPSGCPSTNDTFARMQMRACKYASPRGVRATSSGSAGIPNGPNFMCTTKPLQPLISDTSRLKSLINGMVAVGSTNIHEGFMWGWRTLSPLSVFGSTYAVESASIPAAYGSSMINKIMIVMTDGENSWPLVDTLNNRSLYFAMGYLNNANQTGPNPRLPPGNQNVSNTTNTRAALDALTLQACTNAKAAGISVYTIGFSIPNDPIDQQGLNLLGACASASNQFFVANDSSGLINAFNQIAASIGTLRLTQ